MDYLPLHFNLRGALVLLVGGGEIARRKAVLLSEAGAVLRCIAPRLEFDMNDLSADHEWQQKV
ncbi:MAG: NAD(P)-dependent oxidoreductase, partial [Pseudomonadales bacterium]